MYHSDTRDTVLFQLIQSLFRSISLGMPFPSSSLPYFASFSFYLSGIKQSLFRLASDNNNTRLFHFDGCHGDSLLRTYYRCAFNSFARFGLDDYSVLYSIKFSVFETLSYLLVLHYINSSFFKNRSQYACISCPSYLLTHLQVLFVCVTTGCTATLSTVNYESYVKYLISRSSR